MIITRIKIKQNIIKTGQYFNHPYRISLRGGSTTGKTNALLNLINNRPDNDKTYLHVKNPYEAKYQFLIDK